MTKVRTILKSAKNSDGRSDVLLMVSDRGQRAYVATGFSALPSEFDSSKDVGRYVQGKGVKSFNLSRKEENGGVRTYTNKEANDKLAEIESRAKAILKEYEDGHLSWSMEQFRNDFVRKPKRELFYSFAIDMIESEYTSRGQYGKATIAKAALNSLLDFDKQLEKRTFQDINAKYLNDYKVFCQSKLGHKGNTISIRLREIRRMFNVAIREKVIPKDIYPFSSGKDDGKVKIPKNELSRRDKYLTLDSMKKIAATEFDNPILERTRHLFLFSYYCRGINWKDMALLTSKNFHEVIVTDEDTQEKFIATEIHYTRAKTKGDFSILVDDNIQRELDWFKENCDLLDDYVFPIIRVHVAPEKLNGYISKVRNRFNKSLKEIAEKIGLPESQRDISIYTARHSFAMTLQDSDTPVEYISEALGHKELATTKQYLAKFSTTKMAKITHIDLLSDRPQKRERTKKSRKP